MDRKIEIQHYQLLRTIPGQLTQEYMDNGQFRIIGYNKNDILHMDGNECNRLEIILKGEAIVERIDESGNFMVIAELVPDDILGGNLVFSRKPRYPMTITAKTEMTEYLVQHSHTLLLKMSKKNLAARMGVQRTSLSRELKKMQNEGLIKFDAESITITVPGIILD